MVNLKKNSKNGHIITRHIDLVSRKSAVFCFNLAIKSKKSPCNTSL